MKKRILVIDDEAGVTRSMKLNLETLGTYEVRAENHARAAVQAAREFRPDLILLDIMMPEMEGGEVARHLENDPLLKDTPIIFLTALVTNKETRGREVHLGRWDYLAKPVDLAKLTRVIEAHLQQLSEKTPS
jgi:CheY-like chemotaxis protein